MVGFFSFGNASLASSRGQDRAVPLWVLKGVIKASGAPWQSGAQGEAGAVGRGFFKCFLWGEN